MAVPGFGESVAEASEQGKAAFMVDVDAAEAKGQDLGMQVRIPRLITRQGIDPGKLYSAWPEEEKS